MAHDVFISHSAQNREVADAVCAALENTAIRCWVAPRDVRPGRSFPGEITRAIQQSKVMLLIFSGHSNNSEQVLREVQLATDSRLPIIRFRIEDVALTDDLRYFLSTPHWLDALTPPLSKHIARLELAIKELLGQSVEVTGKNVVSSDVPRAVAPDATPPVPSAVAPAMPPPLPMASPAQKERKAVAPKSFNPWPLLAIAAVVIFAAIIGVIFILLRQPKPSKQQTSTTPSQSAQTPGTVPSPSPLTTRVTQNPASRQARSPKTTPAGDTQHSSESENASAFERAGDKETEIPQAIGPALHAGDSYAAIALSPSTGRWGYGNGFPTKSEAITRARRECGQRDAKTNWCKDAWIALAISNQSAGGWGSSWGDTPEIARSKAISECLSRNPDAHVVLCVSAYR